MAKMESDHFEDSDRIDSPILSADAEIAPGNQEPKLINALSEDQTQHL